MASSAFQRGILLRVAALAAALGAFAWMIAATDWRIPLLLCAGLAIVLLISGPRTKKA